jgi:formate-dependent nitrite reductase membrane component NrfD
MFDMSLAFTAPSDTFFTESPDWSWPIAVYFFVGGLAGGAAFIGAFLDLFGDPADKPAARIGHLLAAPLIAIGGVILVADLKRPERFWHMILQSETYRPMFKWYSAISFGVWVVGAFTVVSGLVFLGVLAEFRWFPDGLRWLRNLHEGALGQILTALSGLLGLFTAGYTGVLLSDSNRPLWGDSTLLGILFLLSGVSAAAALITLIAWRRAYPGTLRWLGFMDTYSSILELAVLVVMVVALGSVATEVWDNIWGILLAVGAVLAGILIPLALHLRPRLIGSLTVPSAALLVIAGSFCLRLAIVMASERT